MPAYFRFLTILAFHIFLQEKVSSRHAASDWLFPIAASNGLLPNAAPDWLLSAFVQVDLAIIEVGIGGAYDCTNVVRWDSA